MTGRRIAIFNNMLSPYTRRVYQELERLGTDLHVLSCCYSESNRSWGSPWLQDEPSRFSQRILRGLSLKLAENRYAHWNFGVGKALDAIDPDVLVINGFYPSMVFGALWALRRKRMLVLTTDGWRNTMPETFYHHLVRPWIIRRCRAVAVCGQKGRNYFSEEGVEQQKLFTIPLTPAWDHSDAISDFDARPFHLLWVAQMNDEVKNFAFFITLATVLKSRVPDLRVRLVGTGPAADRGLMQLQAAGIEVCYDPIVPWQQMAAIYDSARILVLPSLWDPWGLVCNEALQSGVPCIVSPLVGAADELVQSGRNGFVCPLDVNTWVRQIEDVVVNKGLWQSLSINARADATKRTALASAKQFLAMVDYVTRSISYKQVAADSERSAARKSGIVEEPSRSAEHAPIALFVYRRTDLLQRVLDALETCPEFSTSDVFVFSDGPKDAAVAADVKAVRALVRSRLRPNMQLVESAHNVGLAQSIINGVTHLCNEYGRVIVLEDDLIVSPAILTWFNSALNRYATEPRVMQISGYLHDVPESRNREGAFMPFTTSWGWATWKRAWDQFDEEAIGWEELLADSRARRRFDLGDIYPFSRMLKRQMLYHIDSWAIRWYWSVFRKNGLSLFPACSLVIHEGMDSYATHPSWKRRLLDLGSSKPIISAETSFFPREVTVNEARFNVVRRAIARSRLFVPPSIEILLWK